MRISELAQKAGCSVETIRFYESNLLIPKAPRTKSNYRVYGPAHLERLVFIRHCRALDLSLEEIKALVRVVESHTAEEMHRAHKVVEEHLASIDQKIQELQKLREQLNDLHGKCHEEDHAHGHCGLIDGLTH